MFFVFQWISVCRLQKKLFGQFSAWPDFDALHVLGENEGLRWHTGPHRRTTRHPLHRRRVCESQTTDNLDSLGAFTTGMRLLQLLAHRQSCTVRGDEVRSVVSFFTIL
jgi:hypothetical protein